MICNHRFLLFPGVRVCGLASRVLRMAARRATDDWEARYAVRPAAACTHVGAEHSGCCAGQPVAGRTGGCRGEAGTVRILALEPGWRMALRRTEREYGRTHCTDGRVRRRIVDMGRAWMKNTGEDLPVIFPEKAEQKAAYRLLSNPGISMEHALEAHFEATAGRCRAEPFVLAVQDTTALDYTGPAATEGLDRIGGGGKGSAGILAHAGLAVTPEGQPLSLFATAAAFREEPGEDSRRWVAGLMRAGEVEVTPPRRDRGAEPLPMFAVSATEAGTGDGGDPLHRLLLTTEQPAEGEADAAPGIIEKCLMFGQARSRLRAAQRKRGS